MLSQMKENNRKTNKKNKRTLASLLSVSILKKYNVKTMTFNVCGIDVRNKLKMKNNLSTRICKSVREFYQRDDVSRIIAGVGRPLHLKRQRNSVGY